MQHLQPNTTLQGGKYRIERMLGQGGFGITYLAMQTSLQRQVAIKEFFMKEFCSRDEATLSMQTPSTGNNKQLEQYKRKFIKEARNLARLNHPNIISVIEVFEENDTVYYVMPYLSGGSLLVYVKEHGTLSETEAMRYIKQIASALKYMHDDMHICHYDVKPANILLDGKGNAILIDFGISKNYDARGLETSITPVGMSEGYAPIEQYQQNVEQFSPVCDVYALGATLYFLLHGKRPVSAVHRVSGTALLIRKNISQGIKDIINTSMAVSKCERAKSMDVFFDHDRFDVILTNNENPITEDETTILMQSKQQYNNIDRQIQQIETVTYESSNSHWWIIGVIAVVVVLFIFIFNTNTTDSAIQQPATQESSTITLQTPTGSNSDYKQASTVEKYDWSGHYTAIKDAGSTYGGTPVFFKISFFLKKVKEDYYVGTMEIDGYQTMYDVAKIEGSSYGNRIRIFFKSSNDEGINKWSDICTSNNAPLLTLTHSNGQIDAEWYATLCEADVVEQTTPVTKN